MKTVFQRSTLIANLQQAYRSPALLQANLKQRAMPTPLVEWLARLALLEGVPFNYLVPDEAMLPPESLRFFYLDRHWMDALADGAMSIGRNLTSDTGTPELMLQAAVLPEVTPQVCTDRSLKRARAFGLKRGDLLHAGKDNDSDNTQVISGFVLRSSLVRGTSIIGVNAYAKGKTPDDPHPEMLKILRWERLGPTSDTMLCLVAGDIQRVDLHEPPQALHYGVDCFNAGCTYKGQPATATKKIYTFGNETTVVDGVTTNRVTMSKQPTDMDISACFRKDSPRVLDMDKLAKQILQANQSGELPPHTSRPTSIDSAAMGFEMIEGVGMVSFIKSEN